MVRGRICCKKAPFVPGSPAGALELAVMPLLLPIFCDGASAAACKPSQPVLLLVMTWIYLTLPMLVPRLWATAATPASNNMPSTAAPAKEIAGAVVKVGVAVWMVPNFWHHGC